MSVSVLSQLDLEIGALWDKGLDSYQIASELRDLLGAEMPLRAGFNPSCGPTMAELEAKVLRHLPAVRIARRMRA